MSGVMGLIARMTGSLRARLLWFLLAAIVLAAGAQALICPLVNSAEEAAQLTEAERDQRGATNRGPGVIGRADMMQSIDVMIKNSQLQTISGGGEAAMSEGVD